MKQTLSKRIASLPTDTHTFPFRQPCKVMSTLVTLWTPNPCLQWAPHCKHGNRESTPCSPQFHVVNPCSSTQGSCDSFKIKSMVHVGLIQLTRQSWILILISNCTFDRVSPQIFDSKLEVIPQKQLYCLSMCRLCTIFSFAHREPLYFCSTWQGSCHMARSCWK